MSHKNCNAAISFSWGDNSLKTVSAIEATEHNELRRTIIREWTTATMLNADWIWKEVADKISGRMEMSSIYVIDKELTTELRVLMHIAVQHQLQNKGVAA